MTGTTKAVWGAAALVTGVTVLTGVIVYYKTSERISDATSYCRYGFTRKEAKEWIKKSSKR